MRAVRRELPRRGLREVAMHLALALLATASLRASPQDPAKSSPRIHASGWPGSLFLAGGGELSDRIIGEFVRRAGGEEGRLVFVPTAAHAAEEGANAERVEQLAEPWRDRGLGSVTVLHTHDRDVADSYEFTAPLREATAVWIRGGDQRRLARAYAGTRVERELRALLERGGVVGGTSAGAAAQSRVMIAGGNPLARVESGFDLLLDGVVDQHFTERRRQERLRGVLRSHPGKVGLGIDEKTCVVLRGRRGRVLGDGGVTIRLAASPARAAREWILREGAVFDWTALRRAARSRAARPFPPRRPAAPHVEAGTLVIVGGGRVPSDALELFIARAGGPRAKIVVVPTASRDALRAGFHASQLLQRAGARNVSVLHATTLEEVESASFLDALESADGVWFGGGRQWRLVDAYAATRAEELFHAVLERGGVVGGSSAGASIQAEYLVRGNPLGNRDMMAEGYERGFGFLRGVAIDQHFSQRRRFDDLRGVVERFPQLLGIGIDESTALIVEGSQARVVGEHRVYVYDARESPQESHVDDSDNGDDHEASTERVRRMGLVAGESIDLVTGRKVAAEEAKSPPSRARF